MLEKTLSSLTTKQWQVFPPFLFSSVGHLNQITKRTWNKQTDALFWKVSTTNGESIFVQRNDDSYSQGNINLGRSRIEKAYSQTPLPTGTVLLIQQD